MNLVQMQTAARSSLTIIDRIVAYVSPKAGVDRLKSRMALSAAVGSGGYNGGLRDRRATKRWKPGEGSANADTLLDLPDLRAHSRDLVRNTPLATGAIATNVTNIVGDGLQLQASIDAEMLGITPEQADKLEREQESEWAVFCKSADFTRIQHLDELAGLALRSAQESGDVFCVRRYRKDAGDIYGTKIQLIEADRVSNPNRGADSDTISGGVEINGDGVPQAYHITNKHPGNLRTGTLTWARTNARTPDGRQLVIHLYDRTRPELTRGVPYLAPVIELLKQLGDYSAAEVYAAVITAMQTFFIESTADEDANPIAGEVDSSLAENEVKLGYGAVVSLNPGEKVNVPQPMRPNANFDPFFLAITRQIGVALELPHELLIKHFTASYSASRAALEMAWQFFRKRRSWLARNFYQVLYCWMMEEAVATGRLARPGFFEDPMIREAYLGAEWIGPQRASLNPYQEAQADALDMDTGVKTREQVCMERTGGEVEKKIPQLGKERQMMDEAGIVPKAPAASGASSASADNSVAGSDSETQPKPTKATA